MATSFNLKVALDEFNSLSGRIERATPDDLDDILRELAEIPGETERALLIGKLSQTIKAGKRPISADVKRLRAERRQNTGNGDGQAIFSAHFLGLVDIVENDKGSVAYLVNDCGSLSVVYEHFTGDGRLIVPPDRHLLPFALPKIHAVLDYYHGDDSGRLFEDILAYLKRFSYLTDEQRYIAAAKVFLTYLQDHEDIHYLPMLLFWAVPERGKSRTGKAASLISFRGVHVVDLRESNLFRYSGDLRATIFLDCKDLWKKAERNGSEDILLLRYERGARVPRVLYPERGAFRDTVYYDVFGPTVIATNEAVHKILDSRCIPIVMQNRPDEYENPSAEKAQDIKDRLTAFRARTMSTPLPGIDTVAGLSGRFWDITKPLLQVVKLVYPAALDNLIRGLRDIAGDKTEDRKASIEGRIAAIVAELSPSGLDTWTIETSKVLDELNAGRPVEHRYDARYIGKKLRAMGLCTRITKGHSHIQMSAEDLKTLLSEFENRNTPAPGETPPHSPHSPNSDDTTSCASECVSECNSHSPVIHSPEAIELNGNGEMSERSELPDQDNARTILQVTGLSL